MRLEEGPVELRPIRARDAAVWARVRGRNADWLRPWEATSPRSSMPPGPGSSGSRGSVAPQGLEDSRPHSFRGMVRLLNRQARSGSSLPFVMTYGEPGARRLVGQLTVSGITTGSAQWAQIGYWIDQEYAGRGITPTAVALATDHCFFVLGLHRMEINIRPENIASLRVVRKLGFREEGLRPRFLHIDGAWRDHLTFALTAEEVPDGVLARWRARAGTVGETANQGSEVEPPPHSDHEESGSPGRL